MIPVSVRFHMFFPRPDEGRATGRKKDERFCGGVVACFSVEAVGGVSRYGGRSNLIKLKIEKTNIND